MSVARGVSRTIMRRTTLYSILSVFIVTAAPAYAAPEVLPLDQVQHGMKGIGRTVFEGTKIEDFQVEIIGVLENVGPKQSIILARLTGGRLAETGVIAGMSGSPVLIDGKLVGAVAYGFPFSKETIAGITPIGEMIALTETGGAVTARPASARFRLPFGTAKGPLAPLDQATLVSVLQRARGSFPAASSALDGLPASLASQSLTPLALPLVFSGFDPDTFRWARELFGGLGFAPVMSGGAGGKAPAVPLPAFEPGGAIGISLVEGDLD